MKKPLIITFAILFAFTASSLGQAEEVDALLDAWHKAAADNDQQSYFEMIDEDGIYIGTDSSEHWTRKDFFDWSTPYFNEKKGWAFSKKRRNIYFSESGRIAWFDELLDYGKGVLRGSGVLMKQGNEWRIMHYVLSVPVPNDKYKEVMNLIGTKSILKEDTNE